MALVAWSGPGLDRCVGLNGVLGMTELALRGAQGSDQRRYLEAAHDSGQALLQMISDVLDLSRIEAGKVALRERAFEPAQAWPWPCLSC